MKRKPLEKQLKMQQTIIGKWSDMKDDKILIGFYHNKKSYQQLLKNYGEVCCTTPNRLISRVTGNGWITIKNGYSNNVYVLMQDVQEVFLNRYIVIKNGGVYDLECDYFFTRKAFTKLKRLYEHGLVDKDLDFIDSKTRRHEVYSLWRYEPAKDANRFLNTLRHNIKANSGFENINEHDKEE